MNKFGIIGIVMLLMLSLGVMATDYEQTSQYVSGNNIGAMVSVRFTNGNTPNYGFTVQTSARDRGRFSYSIYDASGLFIFEASTHYINRNINYFTNFRTISHTSNVNACDYPFSFVVINWVRTEFYYMFFGIEEWRSVSPAGQKIVNDIVALPYQNCWDYPTANISINEIGVDFANLSISYNEEDWSNDVKLTIDGQEFSVSGTGTQEVIISGLEHNTEYNFNLQITADGHNWNFYENTYTEDSISFTTLRLDGSVNATADDINYPNPVIIEYETTNTNVTILSNGTEIYNGTATGNLEYFDNVGVYNITVIALEDDDYFSANTSFIVEILPEDSGIDLKVNRQSDNITLVYGEPLLIEFSGESVLGYIDGLPVSSGYKETLNSGTYEVFAEVSDSNYNYENVTYIVEVVKAQGHSRIVIERNNIVYPNNISYSIYSKYNQSMDVYINDSLLVSDLLPFGTHEIKVVANESNNYLEHNHSVWVTMNKGVSKADIIGRGKYLSNGTNVSIEGVLIDGDGDIVLTRDGIEVSNPDTSFLPKGLYMYEVRVENSTNYNNGVIATKQVEITERFVMNAIEFNLENVILLIFITILMIAGWIYSRHFLIPFYFLIMSILIFMTGDFHNLYGIITLIVFGFTFSLSNFE